jgi:Protein of unknown function (DUF2690)
MYARLALVLSVSLLGGCVAAMEGEPTEVDSEAENVGEAAQALCPNGNCNTLDPKTYGCDVGASTLDTKDIVNGSGNIIGKVELRYSSSCNAKWAKVWNYVGGNANAYLRDGNTGSVVQGTSYVGPGGQIYGNMWRGYVKACGDMYSGGRCTVAR